MLDIFFIAIILLFFAVALGYTRAIDRGLGGCLAMSLEYLLSGLVTLLVLVYLLYALLRPEHF
jgi:K+-transporting ATPase KdpF subunit